MRSILVGFAIAVQLAASGGAAAQSYPSKPIRLLLPFPPGSPSDIVGRILGQKLSEQLGENLVPDNRVGAGGNLGLGVAAKSPPDGYTVVITSPTIAISPSLYARLPYDAARDLAAIARVASIENVMVVHPSVPAKNLKQFIALARAHPGKLNFGSGGAGTTNHLANELLKYVEKLNMTHVPYKGATAATVALMSGEVDEVIVSVASALPIIRTGRVRPIVVLSRKRVAALPDVPTSEEAGVKGFLMSIWYGLYAPAGTPRDIITRLNGEVLKALDSPDLRKRMQAGGIEPWPSSPEEMTEFVRSETARFATVIRSAGLKPQ
ncbi:MAG: tripartite tricarboxylate transporter substrate binding protein [Betaproteobacteria bacterium]|nr:tripartite tricarboxylate transporter substrate binding protein [Betaproteobacteria bacterium]